MTGLWGRYVAGKQIPSELSTVVGSFAISRIQFPYLNFNESTYIIVPRFARLENYYT